MTEGPTPDPGQKRAVPRLGRSGIITMVGLCFAVGLSDGQNAAFSQATESFKHAFHINDAALGTIPLAIGLVANLSAFGVAALCDRHRRTAVLAGLYGAWGVLQFSTGLARAIHVSVGGLQLTVGGFAVFFALSLIAAPANATDPAALPLLADYYPMSIRAKTISIYQAGSAVGGFMGLAVGGFLVDRYGWQPTCYMWLPFGLLGAALMRTRPEPERGAQDAAFYDDLRRLEENMAAAVVHAERHRQSNVRRREIFQEILRVRSFRLICFGIGVAGIMQTATMFWGTAYFKRTFHLSGVQVAGLAPVIGAGALVGVLFGGSIADRLLRKGVVLARVYVTAAGFIFAALASIAAFSVHALVLAAVGLAFSSTGYALTVGPGSAILLDVIPVPLRSEASAVTDLVQFVSAVGTPVVGLISTLLGDNLRIALLLVSPIYAVGGMLVLIGRGTYLADLDAVVTGAHDEREQGAQ